MRHSLKCSLSALVAGGRYFGLSKLSACRTAERTASANISLQGDAIHSRVTNQSRLADNINGPKG